MILASELNPAFVLSNHIECFFWIAIGIGFYIGAIYRRQDAIIAGCVFVVFGCSDWVEASTGAWWKPWWLFAWKAICVLMLLILIVRYYRRRAITLRKASP